MATVDRRPSAASAVALRAPGADSSDDAKWRARQRRQRAVRVFSVAAFVAASVYAPLAETAVLEKMFALALYCASALLLLFLTARLAFSLILTALVFSMLKSASLLKFAYLLTPVLAPDLHYYLNRDTIDLIGRYPLLLAFTLAMLAAIPLTLIPAWIWETSRDWSVHGRLRAGTLRVLGVCASVALIAVSVSSQGPYARVFNKPMWATVTDRSFLTAFFTSFNDIEVRLPSIVGPVDKTIDWTMPMQPARERHPDIVAVLEESTFDPAILKVCELPVCSFDMFRDNAYTRAGGLLTVHSFGGGTWTAEFALMTGLADVLFGNAGMYAPYNLAPRVAHTLPDVLKGVGYRVIAVYSHSGEFLNARNAYVDYGFDRFYDGTDYGLDWKSTDADLLEVFTRIHAEETAAHPDRPLFIFTLTLHQHGPHMTPLEKLPAPFNRPLFGGKFAPTALDDWLNLNLGNYLERLSRSDAMLRDLRAMLWSSGRDTVLMHFGDHQPSFDGAMHAIPKSVPVAAGLNTSRVTYYRLETSFPSPRLPDYEALDIVYLGSILLDAAGVPKDAFYQANTLLRDRCKGRYLDCADTIFLTSYHDYIFNTLLDLRE